MPSDCLTNIAETGRATPKAQRSNVSKRGLRRSLAPSAWRAEKYLALALRRLQSPSLPDILGVPRIRISGKCQKAEHMTSLALPTTRLAPRPYPPEFLDFLKVPRVGTKSRMCQILEESHLLPTTLLAPDSSSKRCPTCQERDPDVPGLAC